MIGFLEGIKSNQGDPLPVKKVTTMLPGSKDEEGKTGLVWTGLLDRINRITGIITGREIGPVLLLSSTLILTFTSTDLVQASLKVETSSGALRLGLSLGQ